jgi:hypothetical protein
MRTYVYIDGFNLYYRALKGGPHKWLNVEQLAKTVLGPRYLVEPVNDYTARVSGRTDQGAPARQQA